MDFCLMVEVVKQIEKRLKEINEYGKNLMSAYGYHSDACTEAMARYRDKTYEEETKLKTKLAFMKKEINEYIATAITGIDC